MMKALPGPHGRGLPGPMRNGLRTLLMASAVAVQSIATPSPPGTTGSQAAQQPGVPTPPASPAVSGSGAALPPITIRANTAQPVGAPITFGHVFAQGDVPAGSFQTLIASTSGGQTMRLQAAQTNAWPDGSLRYATLHGRSPIAWTAGQQAAFQLGFGSGGLTGTPLTPAQVAAGWTLHVSGGDYGADAFTVAAADVLSTMPQYSLADTPGAYPLGYWELVAQGPLVTEIKLVRCLKRDSDGGSHKWDKGAIYLRGYSDGQGGLLGVVAVPRGENGNVYGPHPSGSVGPATNGVRQGAWELRKDGAVVAAMGGPNDASGLSLAKLYPLTSITGANQDASFAWHGTTSQPAFSVGHDFTYLFRKTGLFPPYLQPTAAKNNTPQAYQTTETYRANQFTGNYDPWPGGINQGSDDPSDERIGYLHLSALRSLLNPMDRNAEIRCLKHGLFWSEYSIWQTDERSAKPVNCGTKAAGPSTPNPGFSTKYGGGQGAPAWMGLAPQWMGAGYPYSTTYNQINDASHQPAPWIVPLLRTGHALFQDIGVADLCAILASTPDGANNVTHGGYTYDCTLTSFGPNVANFRATGWAIRTLGTIHRLMSDGDPMRPYIEHAYSENTLFASIGPLGIASPDFVTNLGMIYCDTDPAHAGTFVASNLAQEQGVHLFADGIYGLAWAVEARLDPTGNWKAMWSRGKPAIVSLYDDQQRATSVGPPANLAYMLDFYACVPWDAAQVPWRNVATMMFQDTQAVWGVSGPYPATGMWGPTAANSGGKYNLGTQSAPIIAAIFAASWFDADAKRVADQIRSRCNTSPLAGLVISGTDGWYPTWAIEIAGEG